MNYMSKLILAPVSELDVEFSNWLSEMQQNEHFVIDDITLSSVSYSVFGIEIETMALIILYHSKEQS